jgi:hypothetical protein
LFEQDDYLFFVFIDFSFYSIEYTADIKIPENSYGKQDDGNSNYNSDEDLPVHNTPGLNQDGKLTILRCV